MTFSSFNPVINFIFFTFAIAFTILFNQPYFLIISYVCSFAFSVKLKGWKGIFLNIFMIPMIGLYASFYSYYTHFGITPLKQNIIGNSITLEAIVYGAVIGITIASVIMWISCIHATMTSDKIIYLFGKILPRLSLYLSIGLRMIPRLNEKTKKISVAQHNIGKGINQGNIFRRFKNLLRIISILIMWSIENFIETSQSMKCRGYTLKGRCAFAIYRFDNRDRCFVIVTFWCASITFMGILLDQTRILYNPEIFINRITELSFVFYIAYLFMLLLPLLIQIVSEIRFKKSLQNGVVNKEQTCRFAVKRL